MCGAPSTLRVSVPMRSPVLCAARCRARSQGWPVKSSSCRETVVRRACNRHRLRGLNGTLRKPRPVASTGEMQQKVRQSTRKLMGQNGIREPRKVQEQMNKKLLCELRRSGMDKSKPPNRLLGPLQSAGSCKWQAVAYRSARCEKVNVPKSF